MEGVLVTGASGFVGSRLTDRLVLDGEFAVKCGVRGPKRLVNAGAQAHITGEISSATNWSDALAGVGVVVHCAARVHIMRDPDSDRLGAFRRVNVEGSINLAKQAASSGVRRMVYLSSVKVSGESGRFNEEDTPAPQDAYGLSKCEAEAGLLQVAAGTKMEVVIVRPPLVYGPGVKANFGDLIRAVRKGIPLPLRSISNLRSLVAIDNLVDLIVCCMVHPAAANQIFFVSDGDDLSTPELIRRMSLIAGSPTRVIPMPLPVLCLGAAMVGKREVFKRLTQSLQVDISKARRLLGWVPPVSVGEGLRRAIHGFSPVSRAPTTHHIRRTT